MWIETLSFSWRWRKLLLLLVVVRIDRGRKYSGHVTPEGKKKKRQHETKRKDGRENREMENFCSLSDDMCRTLRPWNIKRHERRRRRRCMEASPFLSSSSSFFFLSDNSCTRKTLSYDVNKKQAVVVLHWRIKKDDDAYTHARHGGRPIVAGTRKEQEVLRQIRQESFPPRCTTPTHTQCPQPTRPAGLTISILVSSFSPTYIQ